MTWLALMSGHGMILFSSLFLIYILKDNPKSLRNFEFIKMVFFAVFIISFFTTPLYMLGITLTPTDVTSLSSIFIFYMSAMILLLLLTLFLFTLHLITNLFKNNIFKSKEDD